MSLPAELRALQVDLPACPRTLLELLPLLDEGNERGVDMDAMAAIVEADMALAAAVVRTVNSAMFGLLRRVDTVGDAMRYLGTSEVAALTYATALRAAFAPTPQLNLLWEQAASCGLLMGRSAAALGIDPLRAHTAGLFARSGQAVLMAKAGEQYKRLMVDAGDDAAALLAAEQREFGVTHAVYGNALCASWGLANEVIKYVRERVATTESWGQWPEPLRKLLLLGRVADAVVAGADLAEQCRLAAPGSGWSTEHLQAALAPTWARLCASRRA
jgi:HD-like signal output (HDOD) protein